MRYEAQENVGYSGEIRLETCSSSFVGSPIPAEELIRLVARTEDYDEMERVLEEEVLELPFIVQSPDGTHIPNGQDAHIEAADWLQEQTGIDDFKIKATLSRLPDTWPTDE